MCQGKKIRQSWGAVFAISGFHFSAVTAEMSFAEKPGNWFWSNGYSWGTVKISEKENNYTVTLEVLKGNLRLKKFKVGKKLKVFNGGVNVQEEKPINFSIRK